MNSERPIDECYTDFALDEYIAGRLDPSVRAELAVHISHCAECRTALTALESEARLLQSALAGTLSSPAATISEESLALFLAGALGGQVREDLEAALSVSDHLRGRLLELYREARATQREAGSEIPVPAAQPTPEGRVLRMPKRTRQPLTITLPDLKAGGSSS